MVREINDGLMVYNQPAGHVEHGETLIDAVKRETLEETGWRFEPLYLSGIYQFVASNNETYLRFTFYGELHEQYPLHTLDPAIAEVVWMDRLSLQRHKEQLRNQAVLRCIDDYESGQTLSLNLVQQLN